MYRPHPFAPHKTKPSRCRSSLPATRSSASSPRPLASHAAPVRTFYRSCHARLQPQVTPRSRSYLDQAPGPSIRASCSIRRPLTSAAHSSSRTTAYSQHASPAERSTRRRISHQCADKDSQTFVSEHTALKPFMLRTQPRQTVDLRLILFRITVEP